MLWVKTVVFTVFYLCQCTDKLCFYGHVLSGFYGGGDIYSDIMILYCANHPLPDRKPTPKYNPHRKLSAFLHFQKTYDLSCFHHGEQKSMSNISGYTILVETFFFFPGPHTHTHTPIFKRNSNKLEGHKAWFYLHLIDYNSAIEDTCLIVFFIQDKKHTSLVLPTQVLLKVLERAERCVTVSWSWK